MRAILVILIALAACGTRAPAPDALTVTFPRASYALSDQARATVAEASRLAREREDLAVLVVGAAQDPQGPPPSDPLLAQRRSVEVMNTMVSQGVAQSRIQRVTRPAATTVTSNDFEVASRRVEIEFAR